MIHSLIEVINLTISKVGYFGIFLGMFLESTIIPIPSELVMIPAGIAASKNEMSLLIIILIGLLGNVCGAIFSYYLALYLGRNVILHQKKLLLVNVKNLNKIDVFFKKYGDGSVFVGRLLPGFRHFISIPAGIAKMNFFRFTIYTAAGSAIWTSILVFVGYFFGENHQKISSYLNSIIITILIICTFFFAYYYIFRKPVKK